MPSLPCTACGWMPLAGEHGGLGQQRVVDAEPLLLRIEIPEDHPGLYVADYGHVLVFGVTDEMTRRFDFANVRLPAQELIDEVRRMGGGFGGKETQPAIFAGIAAVLADRTKRPVKPAAPTEQRA